MKIRKKILIIFIIISTFINILIYSNPVQAETANTSGSTTQASTESTSTSQRTSTETSNSSSPPQPLAKASTAPEPNFTIYSEGAVLIDASTGSILYGKNENEKLYPASTTKIITAIIAIENCKLTDKITASNVNSSRIF